MAITETLQGCGPWSLAWAGRPPATVLQGLGDTATLLVFDGPVAVSTLTDADRSAALFEGPITTRSTGGISGWEASWLMQRPNGDGYRWFDSGGYTVTNVSNYLGVGGYNFTGDSAGYPTNGLTEGDMIGAVTSFVDNSPQTVDLGGPGYQWGPRAYLDFFIEQLDAATGNDHAWRVGPGLLVDVNLRSTLFRDREVILSDDLVAANSGEAFNIPSVVESSRTVDDYVSHGYTLNSDGSAAYYATGKTNATTVASPGSYDLNMQALVVPPNKDGTDSGYVQRFVDAHGPRVAVEATPITTNSRSRISAGDLLWVHSDYGFAQDTTIDVTHFGQITHPIEMWAINLTWSPTRNNGVVARTAAGTFIDLAPYLALGDHDGMKITLSDSWLPPHTAAGLVNTDRLSAASGRWRYQTPVYPGVYNKHGGGFTREPYSKHGVGFTRQP